MFFTIVFIVHDLWSRLAIKSIIPESLLPALVESFLVHETQDVS